MKKSIIIFLILFLPVISAVTIDMKEEFDQGETLMAKVSGNFFESIVKGNVFFYRDHVRIPMSPFLTKINNDFYIYAQLSGKSENNYSISIKNVKHISGGSVVEEDFSKEFTISNSTADFSISPGFAVANGKFLIEALNLQDPEITIDIVTSSINLEGASPITLSAGEEKKIYFTIDNVNSTFEKIKLSTNNTEYEIPVFMIGVNVSDEEEDNTTTEEESETIADLQKSFSFEQSELDITMPTNSYTIREIYLYNTGEETIKDISLLISGELKNYISISESKIDELDPDSNVKIELEFYSFNKDVDVEGKITAKEQGISTSSEISLNIIPDYIPTDDYEYSPSSQVKTCAELNGEVCSSSEECDTDYVYAKDAKCCVGTCGKGEPSSTGKIIGWSIVGIVVIFLIWFFTKKYRGAKKPANILEVAKSRKKLSEGEKK